MDVLYIEKCRYEIQEQEGVPVRYICPFRALPADMITAVYAKNHTKPLNTLLNVEAGNTYTSLCFNGII
jgi:hypothetical protein